MAKRWNRLDESFEAEAENGVRYTIRIYTPMIEPSTVSDSPSAPLEGLQVAMTSDGLYCNRINEDTYEIVSLGLRVTRIIESTDKSRSK